ncbi:MAG TPA: site-2 protease family protein [Clostridia bacterium]|jgi:regulator of sigma E protease|nr:site-2 protease family protein [Clostridia bacterium]
MVFLLSNFIDVLQTTGYIILGLLALTSMIIIHELGHYVAGKALGFKIIEFGVGFGPPVYKHINKRNGEIFSIRPIPLGGFCRFESEDDEYESNSPTAFDNKPAWKRIIVLASGALFNLISALIIISIFFSVFGQVMLKVEHVYPDSENHIMKGDIVLKVNGHNLNVLETNDAFVLLKSSQDTADIVVLRNGKQENITINKYNYIVGEFDENGNFTPTLVDEKEQTNYGFGFVGTISVQKISFGLSLERAFSFTFFVVYKVFEIFGRLLTGKLGIDALGGPVSTIQVMTNASRSGIATLLYAISIISANIAVMNLLPIPALDGARIVFCIVEIITKKPISKKVQGIIHTIGFLAIILFAILIDVLKFI